MLFMIESQCTIVYKSLLTFCFGGIAPTKLCMNLVYELVYIV